MSGNIGSLLETAGRTAFSLAYVASPIMLTGGIAAQYGIDGILPIAVLTSGLSAIASVLSGNSDLSNLGATFMPTTGATLAEIDIGSYPFANQAVAANATIFNPLHVSMTMIAPVQSGGGYTAKLATMTALKTTIYQHNALGGTYTVITPSYFYTNCILLKLSDMSTTATAQTQYMWQFDFVQPLISLANAQQVYGNFTQKMSQQLPNTGATSGPNVAAPSTLNSGGALTPGQSIPSNNSSVTQ